MNSPNRNAVPLVPVLLLLASFALSGCAGAIIGVGSAAVAASTTEKGISTSVSDGVIFTKLHEIQINIALTKTREGDDA